MSRIAHRASVMGSLCGRESCVCARPLAVVCDEFKNWTDDPSRWCIQCGWNEAAHHFGSPKEDGRG